jgi:uncharacterized protein (TIGR01777 family)
MRVAVIGATGFVGRHLTAELRKRGDVVVTVSLRDPSLAAAAVAACDAAVNLSGEPIAQRWNALVKQQIAYSRTEAPRKMLESLAECERHPSVFVSASAIGYYGSHENEALTEASPPGDDFLAQVCVQWEREAQRAANMGIRVAIVRTGVALGRDGGALGQMLPAFKAGFGGIIGSGRQWVSWIHVHDLVGMYLHCIDQGSGAFNATAPNPVTNAEFTRQLGHALHRPTVLPVPSFALRAMFGEGADVLTTGQRVLPARAEAEGFAFAFPTLDAAFADIFPRN